MCCILRRGCRKETTQEGHKRYRFRSDWDKSGTMTSSETRITEALAPGVTDNINQQTTCGNDRPTAGALVRIEEETAADTYTKTEDITRENQSTVDDETAASDDEQNQSHKKEYVELESDEQKRLIDGETTTCSFKTGLNLNKKSLNCTGSTSKGRDDRLLTTTDDTTEFSSNCSVGESLKELMVVE